MIKKLEKMLMDGIISEEEYLAHEEIYISKLYYMFEQGMISRSEFEKRAGI